MNRPEPKNEEIILDPKRYIVSKTDEKGIIEYGNDYFVEISGYTEAELIGKPHNIIRHPDMPKVIFKILWENIKQRKTMKTLVKNLAKDGRYYWVYAEVEPRINPTNSEIVGYTAYRKAAPRKAVKEIEALYKKLKDIEDKSGVEASEKYLMGFLDDNRMSYDQFISSLIEDKGLFKSFFGKMKRIFG